MPHSARRSPPAAPRRAVRAVSYPVRVLWRPVRTLWRPVRTLWRPVRAAWRHPRFQRVLTRASTTAERLWRAPLVLAAVLFALSGPAHALGRTDAVFYASLAGLTLGGAAVPLGLLALHAHPTTDTTTPHQAARERR
jgi:hypothetical protein